MTVLSSGQRSLLSDVVVRARDVVEAACAQRITALGVAADKAPEVLTNQERAVGVGLRARARQLGSVDALITEAGFEHWHRMLFARFLADNGLLIDNQFGQPLTMDEVAEYAAETGETEKWEVAARFAAAMLPGIFTQGDPVLAMRLPVETRQELDRLLDRLPAEVITAEDSLGWVYQYWQAKRKSEVNQSERKIGGADLAPVTQLFTEDYMVRFLLENSLGAWWAARHPDSPLLAEWEYLRRNENGSPAVGGFDGWPEKVAEVTVMDPCCGSGHFLTAAFGMLWRMRAEEEQLAPVTAQDAVLRDNLFGLELDPRCTQIAAFALALEAWKAGGYRTLPLPNVACCGIPARAPLSDWLNLAAGDPLVEAALTRLHALFANANTLGSLIDPVRATEQAGLESIDWHQVAPLLQRALTAETGKRATDPAAAVFGHAAAGIARAADYLSHRYTLIATNPPYLKRAKQVPLLAKYCEQLSRESKQDLATTFLARALVMASTVSIVSPQHWLQAIMYLDMRRRLLRAASWHAVARLGGGTFDLAATWDLKIALTILSGSNHPRSPDGFILSTEAATTGEENARGLASGPFVAFDASDQLQNPDARIVLTPIRSQHFLHEFASAYQGTSSGDNVRFTRKFWEVSNVARPWAFWQSTTDRTRMCGGRSNIVLWYGEAGVESKGAAVRGKAAWGRLGIAVSQMGNLASASYSGDFFDNNVAMMIPRKDEDRNAIARYIMSPQYAVDVRKIDSALKVMNATLTKVPFDLDHWQGVCEAEGFVLEASTDDGTQWLFSGRPTDATQPLQVSVARLVGFRWPNQEPDDIDILRDLDGVVCLLALGGEAPASERLRAVLAASLGGDWSPAVLSGLLADVGGRAGGLGGWLRDGFFKDHCRVFANRPFIWQIWDGRPDGFSALVNYHKLDRQLLERLTYDYLGSWWMGRLNDEVRREVPGAEARLVAAEELKRKLQLILEGEPPYDIFVRWKSLAEQPLGWEPDLDDGVRLNIRPFMNAGVLRFKPNIKWEKDRGKNPDGTERPNDLHFTLAEKRAAREGAAQ